MQQCRLLKLATATALLVLPAAAWCSPADQCSEPNEILVAEYYDLAINQKDFAAASKYMGSQYIQHNPAAPDGPEGLEQFIGYLRENLPDYRSEIKRCFSDGDFVILHVHNKPTPDATGKAIVDIFRLEGGKVVEHWDVIQDIPEDPKNDNTMF
jgi:predicted SnoaL-like aldol condensation-catalyzing enzyme